MIPLQRASMRRHALAVLVLGLALAPAPSRLSMAAPAPPAATVLQPRFASADDAVTALINAARTGDVKALSAILGAGSARLIASGDPVADRNARKTLVAAYDARHRLDMSGPDRAVLTVGDNDWPFPFPVVRLGGQWQFDATAGAEQLIDRRIGRNELFTIRTLLTLVEAEKDYFDRTLRGVGTGFYAQRVISSPGKYDGLYWETADGVPQSPLGPLIDQVRDEGYPAETTADGKPVPYHGYLYRLLKSQGPSAPGGAKDYVRNGRLTEGFAFLAWPAHYGNSGITSFLVGPDGTVFQKDLGEQTAKATGAITRFDPDPSWARIDLEGD